VIGSLVRRISWTSWKLPTQVLQSCGVRCKPVIQMAWTHGSVQSS